MEKYLGHRININLTEELWDRVKAYPQIRWSVVGRELIAKYINQLEEVKEKVTVTR